MGSEVSGEVEEGIARFIAGDYAAAQSTLESVDPAQLSDEERAVYFLYLGRARLAQQQYQGASDAFLVGRQYGDVERFDAYLVEVDAYLRAEARSVELSDRVTRAQLAKQLHEILGGRLVEGAGALMPADMDGHWAREHVGIVVSNGLMTVMADGGFHPNAPVTRASFAVLLARLGAAGHDSFVKAVLDMDEHGRVWLSNPETTGALRSIASASP